MPTYEYECEKCGISFEKFQSMKDDPIKKCPECDGAVRRLIGAGAGFIFKGSGFYITDYRSESYKQDAKKDKDKDPDSASGSATSDKKSEKSEKKSETKSETKPEKKSEKKD